MFQVKTGIEMITGGWRRATAVALVLAVTLTAASTLAQDSTDEPTVQEAAEAADAAATSSNIMNLLIVIALFVVPIVIGNWLGKRLKMPDHGWKFSVAIGTLAAAIVLVSPAFFEDYSTQDRDYVIKLGPDLSGGVTLIYELAEREAASDADSDGQDVPQDILIEQLIGALTERVDPSGIKEVTIRKYGEDQIEIIIPRATRQDEEMIQRRISTAGALEFRIVASRIWNTHQPIIELAEGLPPGRDIVRLNDRPVGRWVAFDEEKFAGDPDLVTRMSGGKPQALILTNDNQNVTGEFLRSASATVDELGQPLVIFRFNSRGAVKFGALTGAHLPNPSGQEYRLGILLDGKLLSAPGIQGKIRDSGEIRGVGSEEEVNFIVGILNAGSLPAALNKEPISKEEISPTLGAETIEKGKLAVTTSLVAVIVFMAIYYRFAGFVACFALAANLLLILGAMVLIKGAFTLPGLAGLVLTVGMSVDANVLIFERIREELNRGAALRMAIRNGFARATQTIVDANVTTLITGVVIYKIAPDNVKGFGVTLILGILMSMYTAIFLSRLIFDVAERSRWLKQLSMARIIGETKLNFLGKTSVAAILSVIVISVGMFGVFGRGDDLLNIDFTGGSSVTIVLDDEMPFSDVKTVLDGTELAEGNISLVEVGDGNTRYTVTTVNPDVNKVQDLLAEAFNEKLRTYQVNVSSVTALSGGEASLPSRSFDSFVDRVLPGSGTPVSYAMLQNNDADEPAEGDPTNDAEESESTNGDEATTPPADGNDSDAEPVNDDDDAAGAETNQRYPAANDEGDDATAGGDETITSTDPFAGGTEALLEFGLEGEQPGEASADAEATSYDGISYEALEQQLTDALTATGNEGIAYDISNPDYLEGSGRRFRQWTVKLALPTEQADQVFGSLRSEVNGQPVFPLANKIGGRVAGRMQTDAIAAIIISLLGIIAYIWFRFQRVIYGLAAVVALVHDVLVTVGFVALSAYVVDAVPPLAGALMIEKFQISLPLVAAFLTIIGYSLNDTIVVFDRIREVKGKSPQLTKEMINASINQTLSRTLLTSLTTLLTVVVLYVLGGDGIHAFAFALVVGVIVGTYSSIFVASPALLWMSNRAEAAEANSRAKAA